jgi:rod shape-determining protein MreD
MRAVPYFILAYLALGLQLGLAPYMRFQGAVPNFVLLCVVYIAVNAAREPALLGCFSLGIMQDILSQQPFGLYAFAYGVVAMFVISTQELVYREHPLTHVSVTFIGGLLTAAVLIVHGLIHPPGPVLRIEGQTMGALRIAPMSLFTTAVYTAVLAVPVLGILQRIRKLFAFDANRRKLRVAGREA